MFIDMLNNPEFDKYDMSSLQKGNSKRLLVINLLITCTASIISNTIPKIYSKELLQLYCIFSGVSAGAPCPVDIMNQVISKMNMKGLIVSFQ